MSQQPWGGWVLDCLHTPSRPSRTVVLLPSACSATYQEKYIMPQNTIFVQNYISEKKQDILQTYGEEYFVSENIIFIKNISEKDYGILQTSHTSLAADIHVHFYLQQ